VSRETKRETRVRRTRRHPSSRGVGVCRGDPRVPVSRADAITTIFIVVIVRAAGSVTGRLTVRARPRQNIISAVRGQSRDNDAGGGGRARRGTAVYGFLRGQEDGGVIVTELQPQLRSRATGTSIIIRRTPRSDNIRDHMKPCEVPVRRTTVRPISQSSFLDLQ